MIAEHELRIGNYVSTPDCECWQWEFSRSDYDFYEMEQFNPIALSDEWLVRLGFEMDNSGVEKDHEDYCDWYQRKFPVIGELITNSDKSFVFDMETDTLRIRYVHQLQNLYFALTGCELPIVSADHVPDVKNMVEMPSKAKPTGNLRMKISKEQLSEESLRIIEKISKGLGELIRKEAMENMQRFLVSCDMPVLTEEELELIKQREVDLVKLAKIFENIQPIGFIATTGVEKEVV